MRVIGFGAHPDDVEIFFLGTLAAAQAAGAEIGWVIATDGSKGGEFASDSLKAMRRREAHEAAAIVDVSPVFLDRADGELAGDGDAAELIQAALDRLKPDLVITHAPNDYHPDHRALSRLVRDGARFHIPVVFADTLMGVSFEPTIYVDITGHVETKRRAIRCHVSQEPERFVKMSDAWTRFRALQCNSDADGYAECFRFEPAFPFADIRALLPPAPACRPFGGQIPID
jgi:LmbE family N-acetylglucosaminyl deacetylase